MTETWFENSPSAFIRRAGSTLAAAKVDPKLSARDEESPPWESPRPSLQFFNEEEKESGRRKDHLEIYTDGAKTKDGRCGAAFTIPSRSITHSVSLAGCPAVLSCELTAIYLAMKWIAENRKGKKMVITDSKQALKEICAVGGRKAGHLVESIQRMWQILKEEGESRIRLGKGPLRGERERGSRFGGEGRSSPAAEPKHPSGAGRPVGEATEVRRWKMAGQMVYTSNQMRKVLRVTHARSTIEAIFIQREQQRRKNYLQDPPRPPGPQRKKVQ